MVYYRKRDKKCSCKCTKRRERDDYETYDEPGSMGWGSMYLDEPDEWETEEKLNN